MTGMEHAGHGDTFDTSPERVHETANREHVGMEQRIEQAARIIDDILCRDPEVAREMFGDEPDRIARTLAEAGLLAPEPEPTVPASQLRAFARLCVDGGDMTPTAARMLDRIIEGES